MCHTDNFCGCMTVEAGAITAFIFSLIFGIIAFAWTIFILVQGISTTSYGVLVLGTVLLVLCILFVIASIFLICGVMASRAVFVKIWLIIAAVTYFIIVALLLVTVLLDTYGPLRNNQYEIHPLSVLKWIVIVGLIIFSGFMIYLWIVVINYYWQIKPAPVSDTKVKNVVYIEDWTSTWYYPHNYYWRQPTYHPQYYYR